MKLNIREQVVETTEAYDTYFRFAAARQAAFYNRLEGREPWTADAIISEHRFTNVYRASDRVSQYLIRNVIYDGVDTSPRDQLFRILLFKIFNRIETWEALEKHFGRITWATFRFGEFDTFLDELAFNTALDGPKRAIYSAAYMMPSPDYGEPRKHANHLRLLQHMIMGGFVEHVEQCRSLEELYRILLSYRSIGKFLAFQLAIDINYSPLTNFSEMEFVVAGPGALDGISKLFNSTGRSTTTAEAAAEIIYFMAEHFMAEMERLGLEFRTVAGRAPQLIDCQNVFCEVSKYTRVSHPDLLGMAGRSRIKQKYRASKLPLAPQFYPPKWSQS